MFSVPSPRGTHATTRNANRLNLIMSEYDDAIADLETAIKNIKAAKAGWDIEGAALDAGNVANLTQWAGSKVDDFHRDMVQVERAMLRTAILGAGFEADA